jgi:ParB-like chromosome segregation protein Spo0J
MLQVKMRSVEQLKPNLRNARRHSKKQIRQLADSITAFGFLVPVLIDDTGVVIAGHGRFAAAKLLGLQKVPVIEVAGLSEAKRRALALADNKIAANGGWDRKALANELSELGQILVLEELDITVTGFTPIEIDNLITDFEDHPAADPADILKSAWVSATPLSKHGDLWILGQHRLLCGNARNTEHVARLMGNEQATMAFLDPPYDLKMRDMAETGATEHSGFATASGEVSQLVTFLTETLDAAAAVSRSDAIHYVGADGRHLAALIEAGRSVYGEMLDLIVWVKSTADQGSFYRNQHELIGVFRVAVFPELNVKKPARRVRSRSNVWEYPVVDSFRSSRLDQPKGRPTAKPVPLVADALKDCTRRGDIVIDIFGGCGTTILAAERAGRRAYTMEIEPRYVDVAIRRWQEFSGQDAVHADTGRTFDALANEAIRPPEAENPPRKEAA